MHVQTSLTQETQSSPIFEKPQFSFPITDDLQTEGSTSDAGGHLALRVDVLQTRFSSSSNTLYPATCSSYPHSADQVFPVCMILRKLLAEHLDSNNVLS